MKEISQRLLSKQEALTFCKKMQEYVVKPQAEVLLGVSLNAQTKEYPKAVAAHHAAAQLHLHTMKAFDLLHAELNGVEQEDFQRAFAEHNLGSDPEYIRIMDESREKVKKYIEEFRVDSLESKKER